MSEDVPHKRQCEHVNLHVGTRPIIGENSWTANGSLIDCHAQVTIGRDVFVGHRVMIITGGHDYRKFGDQRKKTQWARPVTIEDGVWIGSGAIICPGVTVGKHAVVGAGAVVMSNVAPYTLVLGNPARPVRNLNPDQEG